MSNYNAFSRGYQKMRKLSPGSSNYKPWGEENFQIALDESVRTRTLKSDGEEAFIFMSHWIKKRGRTCSADLEGFDGRCMYCHGGESPKPRAVIELIDYRYFHKILVTKDGREYTNFERCASDDPKPTFARGRGCKHCAGSDPEVRERHFGGHKKRELSEVQFAQIQATNSKIGETCVHLDGNEVCGGSIILIGVVCSHCEKEIYSEQDLIKLDEEKVDGLFKSEQECPHCNTVDFYAPALICEKSEKDGTNHEAKPAMIYDKDIEITCTGVAGKDGKKRPQYSYDKGYDFTNPVDSIMDMGFSEKEAQEMMKPWDLHYMYRPEFVDPDNDKFKSTEDYVQAVLEAQAKVLGVPVPDAYKNDAAKPSGRSLPYRRRS